MYCKGFWFIGLSFSEVYHDFVKTHRKKVREFYTWRREGKPLCAATPLLQTFCLFNTLDSLDSLDSNPTKTSPLHTGLTETNGKYISENLLAAVMLLARLTVNFHQIATGRGLIQSSKVNLSSMRCSLTQAQTSFIQIISLYNHVE